MSSLEQISTEAYKHASKLYRLRDSNKQTKRICFYLILVVVGSLISLSEEYKFNKANILNQWFVKLGWFWTNALLLPLLFMTTSDSDRNGVFQICLRFLSTSFVWYFSVNMFQSIDDYIGYDISGHTFLLTFSNLIISSELDNASKKQKLVQTDRNIRIIRYSLLILTFLWDFMLIQTILFYHTWFQKVLGLLWSIVCYLLLYLSFDLI